MSELRSITITELQSAYQKGVLTLGQWQLDESMWARYSTVPFCQDPHDAKYCLYLFLYALDSWKDDCDYNFLNEEQLIAILNRVESLQQAMCDCSATPQPQLPPTKPIVHNGTYTQGNPSNPTDISGLAMATNGTLKWYVNGTGQSNAPDLPTNPGVYTGVYTVSQVNTNGESLQLAITITILPQQVTTAGYTACPTVDSTPISITFNNVDDGATLSITKNGTYYGTSLSIDPSTAQNDNYTVTQTIGGFTSLPTAFNITVFTLPSSIGTISGPTSPTGGTGGPTYTFSVVLVPGVVQYRWTLPDSSTSSGVSANGINSITYQFPTTGSKTISILGYSSDGCLVTGTSHDFTVVAQLANTVYTTLSNAVMTGRVYTGTLNVDMNPGDTLTYGLAIIDNPMNANITPPSGTITSGSTAGSHNFSIDASSSFAGGAVVIEYTLLSSTLGATLGNPKSIDVQITFPPAPHCAEGYTLSEDQTVCTKELTQGALVTHSDYCLASSQNGVYSDNGTRIYNIGFSSNSISTFSPAPSDIYALMTTTQWKGPMNRVSVWIDANCDGVIDPLTRGAQATIATSYNNVGGTRIIYVGIAGDNQFILTVNGVIVAQTLNPTSVANFVFWHIFPVTLIAGTNYFNATGTGDGSTSDAIGMTIYDNTPLEIENATSDGQLNILWSSAALRGQHVDVATCAVGWNLDTSGGVGHYICTQIATTSPEIG
jgi:PKD-like domain